MAQNLDLLLCILPFEKEIFAKTPLNVAYVGHPLVERLKTYSYKTSSSLKKKKSSHYFPEAERKRLYATCIFNLMQWQN